MSAVLDAPRPALQRSQGVWQAAWRRLRADRVGMVCGVVVLAFLVMIVLSAAGLISSNWQRELAVPNAPPGFVGPRAAESTGTIESPRGPNVDLSDVDPLAARYQEWNERAAQLRTVEAEKLPTLPLGADRLGRDVLAKAVKGSEVSIFAGVLAALVATLLGTALGACAGFFGGRSGDLLEWLYNVFTSIPGILLIFAFAAVFGRGIATVVLILGLTGWTGVYRLVRAEYLKHAQRDYVCAAQAIGASAGSRMFRHILPNVSHVILVQLSILGVPVDQVSWGTMLAEAQSELLLGRWWQLAAATLFMAAFVTAFSLLTDALRDALDPKLRGIE